ncbi:acetate--CoA ligase family protein [Pigmentiphaga humi]|uniref:acetate--CoA ligase family protein n=1 Tax=Pigmentiphaga humi TaxID=2478468 RepID=UPI0013592B03|nr:acetate--CoA ligase family protein [Pigmentiphaga humi]
MPQFIEPRDRDTAEAAIRALMEPASIAFVGASTSYEKMSGQPVRNVGAVGYGGRIVAVNARGDAIAGVETVRSVTELPQGMDIAVVTVPAAACPQAVRNLGARGAKAAIIAVAGFAELGTEEGRRLSAELLRASRESGVRLIGPVCNGIYSTPTGLSLGYNEIHTRPIRRGRIGLASHSGALVAPFVTLIEQCGAGLSRYISAGSEIDLGMSDFIRYLADDPETSVIALILDHVGDGGEFRRAIRLARDNGKSVLVLKLGNSALGSAATLAHSSNLAGTKHVYDAVFAAEGIRSVPTLESMAYASALLSQGKRVDQGGVVACSTSGGGAIILADQLSAHRPPIPVPSLDASTVEEVARHLLFDAATILNPFDLGLGGRHHYAANIMALARDPQTAVLLVFGTPMATPAKREQLAGAVAAAAAAKPALPILYLSPAALFDDERSILQNAGIPVCGSTLEAIAVAAALAPRPVHVPAPAACTAPVPSPVQPGGPLSEHRSKELLRRHGIDFAEEALVDTVEAAVNAAQAMGYPVVLKASGQGIWHKSEMGLVAVGLASADALRDAWHGMQASLRRQSLDATDGFLVCRQVREGVEVLLGITRDPEFGPVAVLGPGGVMAELFGAEAMRHLVLPTSRPAVEQAIDDGPLAALLAGFRGAPACDRDAFVDLVLRVCAAAGELGDGLQEIDLNPVKLAPGSGGAWPLDALVVFDDETADR